MKIEHGALPTMSGPELVALYNKLTGERVKRFENKKTAVAKVLSALGEPEPAAVPVEAPPPAARAAQEGVAPVAQAVTAPAASDAANPPENAGEKAAGRSPTREHAAVAGGKLPRPGSKRGQLLALLLGPDGLTIDEICQRFEWKPNDAKDALYLLAKKNGVAVMTGVNDGRWRVASKG